MAERSFPWQTNNNGDGPSGGYGSDRLQEAFIGLGNSANTTAGVLAGIKNSIGTVIEFAVTTGGTTNVSVAAGWGLVNGTFYTSDAATTVAVGTPTVSTRIDRIVLRWTASTTQTVRITKLTQAEGVGTDVALTQSATIWDIPLARVTITTGGAITLIDQRAFVKSTGVRGALDGIGLDWNTTTNTAQLKAGGVKSANLDTDLSITGGFTSTKTGGGPSGGLSVVSAQPAYTWFGSTAATDNKVWDAAVFINGSSQQTWNLRAVNDANSAAATALSIVRSGAGIVSVLFPSGVVDITNHLTVHGNNATVGTSTLTGDVSMAGALTVTGEIFRVPKILWRQGGNATDWDTPGSTNYQPNNVRAYFGTAQSDGSGDLTITFPVTFTAKPVVTLTSYNASPIGRGISVVSVTAGAVVIKTWGTNSLGNAPNQNFFWQAVGSI